MVEWQDRFKLSTAIMTHPARIKEARALAESVAELSPKIMVDPAPVGRTIPNAVRSWNAVEDDATHHLVLQDDARVCADFVPILLDAIAEIPDHALSLYTSWSSRTSNFVRIAALNGSRWAEVCDHYLPCIGLVLPAPVAKSFSLSSIHPDHIHDDFALLDHIKKHGIVGYMHVPNLVEHAEIPTVAGNHVGTRHSSCFRDEAAGAEPGRGIVEGRTILPHFSWSRRGGNWLYRRDGKTPWRGIISEESVLEYLGVDLGELGSHYEGACREWPEASGVVDASAQRALWLVAFGLGMAAGGTTGHVDSCTAAARTALSTLAPGAWRLMAEDHVVARRRDVLAKFFTGAVDLGASYIREGKATAFDGVSLPDTFLEEPEAPASRFANQFAGSGVS